MKVQTKKVASNYLKLSKLRIVELLLITTVPSMVVSIYGFPPVELVLFTLFGGTALAISANVLNQIFEIETDKLMARTSDRPLVVGTISVKNAYIYSILLALNRIYDFIHTNNSTSSIYCINGKYFLLIYIYIDFKT